MRIVNKNSLAANIFDDLLNNDVLLFYYGELEFAITNQIIWNFSQKLKEIGGGKTKYNKIYSSLIEGIENACKHQKKINANQLGLILVSRNKDSFYISVGNPIDSSKRVYLDNKINELKNKSRKELSSIVRDNIGKADLDKDDSANIGLIKILLNSEFQTTTIFKELDKNELLFIIQMKIDL